MVVEWIRSSERLPPVGEAVLVVMVSTYGYTAIAELYEKQDQVPDERGHPTYVKSFVWFPEDGPAMPIEGTYWMPLPKAPSE